MTEDYKDPDVLRRRYRGADGEESMAALGEAFGVNPSTIQYWLNKYDIGDVTRRKTSLVKLTEETKARLDAANREGESLSETVARALDCLESFTALENLEDE